jgi:hypothetical protein
MFHPVDQPMERGWVGRIEGEHVVHLAAQTLQAFFTGGGSAREHAVYPLDGVRLLAPVLHPPSVRVFDSQTTFEFRNPAAIVAPGATIADCSGAPGDGPSGRGLTVLPRIAAVVGADGEIGGLAAFAEWRRAGLGPPKDRDFALGLGPVVVTPDEGAEATFEASVRLDGEVSAQGLFGPFDWEAARLLASEATTLYAGDLLVSPALETVAVGPAELVELEVEPIGILAATVQRG